MASASQPSALEGDRDATPSAPRRQILTRRGSHEAPPRVVLRLPDLEALSAVALGPPRPAPKRRTDPPHTASPTAVVSSAGAGSSSAEAATAQSAESRTLLKVFKTPLEKLINASPESRASMLAKAVVLLQQPKMLLAAIAAIGLQLAAVLAMFTGGSTHAPSPSPVAVHEPSVTWPSPTAGGGRIQTPLTLPNFIPGGAMPSPSVVATPAPAAVPVLPPPQALPGLDSRDLPPWPTDPTPPSLNAPQIVGPAPAANQPAKLSSPTLSVPTLAPPRTSSPVAEQKSGSEGPTAEAPSSALPNFDNTTPAVPASQSGDATVARPKARLQGTIKKASVSGVAQ